MNRWRKWRGLAWAERLMLLQAAALIVCARLWLPRIDFRAQPGTVAERRSIPLSAAELTRVRTIAHLVGIASNHCPQPVTCLPRSLALWWLLRWHGIPCELRLGATHRDGQLDAHAWVQCAGAPLGEEPAHLSRYVAFEQAVIPRSRWVMRRLVTPRVS